MTDIRDIQADQGSVAAGEISNSTITIINQNGSGLSKAEALQLEVHYLKRLMQDCAGLEWLRLVSKQNENASSIRLDAVYTALLTTHRDSDKTLKPKQGETGSDSVLESEAKHLSALAMLNREDRLVLTGDPGSGKSAFVNYLALCLAGEHLEDKRADLKVMTEPLPDDSGNPETEAVEVEGKDESEQREVRQPWVHGALIPVRIILRDFSASPCFPGDREEPDTGHVAEFLQADLKAKDCADYGEVLRARLRCGEALVMFDGLDEVPQAGERRQRLLTCIEKFTRTYPDCRVLVTCRPYAYQNAQWQLPGFAQARLAAFTRGQMIRFIRRWYGNSAEFDAATAQVRIGKLQQAILSRGSLFELAKRPLLLSLIAYLHAHRHELPEQRADLYERLLELLIDEWEKARFKTEDADAARIREQYSLAEYLQIGQDTIRLVLERLAFKAHALQDAQQQGTADIAASDLIFQLSGEARDAGKKIDPWELCEYLRDRVGILYQRGGETEMNAVYTFPHRSFQEYLAAAYFRREEDGLFEFFREAALQLDDEVWQELAAHLGRTDPDRWREVIILSGGIKAAKEPGPVWELLDALMSGDEDDNPGAHAWGLRLAAEILAENLKRDNLNRRQRTILASVQQALPGVLDTGSLPVLERVAVGRYLAKIGDPRPEVTHVDAMRFCHVPNGPFFMGQGEFDKASEKWGAETPAMEYLLVYDYWIAQYPVTVAQFKAFVDDSGFELGDADALKADSNSPVVWISQQEALAFCDWLTQRWRKNGWLAEGLQVTLPNEPEWEKAARGGLEIPVTPTIADIATLSGLDLSEQCDSIENPEPQRRYPWGNEINEKLVNYEMNAGGTSTPGVYGLSASPYGCHDLAGNVWEWTRSEYGDYPYPAFGTASHLQREGNNPAVCVLRGGAFYNNHLYVRCAVRRNYRPGPRNDFIGFRVVLSPCR
ncbi:SUMF1/EgtB/PvdO family nonheme iron enzyme [Nitrosomonas sp.]|uniref:SUMF1/EgtB/PvdO family nonheme iron enzyme n=1 Tax=Nitrosomonas sp. TaxID=42353 RepID=UPI00284C9F2A|nr:SUMF1/EgtB/PvdO family nonheme iron enzyme [Nitrosomonas sp.]MDR4513814.1 SUMF1/EgtB/PvdO family nonheme iron enzyme [Nitrosomonas sp.]